MTVKNEVCLFLIILVFGNISAQKKVFYDEDSFEIDAITYTNKCSSPIFSCVSEKIGHLEVYTLTYNFAFRTLNIDEINKLNALITKGENHKSIVNKTFIISYSDTLYGFNARMKDALLHHKSLGFKTKFEKKHFTFYENKILKKTKELNKCQKRNEKKYETYFLQAYTYDKGYLSEQNNEIRFVQDDSFFRNFFFDSGNNFKHAIINPNGACFIFKKVLTPFQMKSILKNKNWNQIELDLSATIHTNSINGIGFFKKDLYINKTKCLK
ncbi:hypothetical protein A9Q87_04725 [Flavobacteriales bacterium 34_180_T64]|nr:hypothetical protein A9Q87_04725 [Flavobacteriales bacterium 34_180_T64]